MAVEEREGEGVACNDDRPCVEERVGVCLLLESEGGGRYDGLH